MSVWCAVPIAAGHVAAVALVAAAVALGMSIDRVLLQTLSGGLLLLAAALCLSRRTGKQVRASAGHMGLALGSFIVATAHGAGLMLVPALIPLCVGNSASTTADDASGALLTQALMAVGVHGAAMLAVTGTIAMGLRPLLQRLTGFSTKS